MLRTHVEQDIEEKKFGSGHFSGRKLTGSGREMSKMSKNCQKRAKNMEYTDILIKLITVPPYIVLLINYTGDGVN